MHVLVVEDDPDLAFLTGDALSRIWGHTVTVVARDFAGLLDAPAWEDVDGAVVDLWLDRDVNGIDVLRWLADHRPDIRRVAYSAALSALEVGGLAHAVVLKGAGGAKALHLALGGGDPEHHG